MEIIIPKDCGNAPRKMIIIDFIVACLNGEREILAGYSIDTVEWHDVKENRRVIGLKKMIDKIEKNKLADVQKLCIEHVITHGKLAAIHGEIIYTQGNKTPFCIILEFSSAGKSGKIKRVKSYVI